MRKSGNAQFRMSDDFDNPMELIDVAEYEALKAENAKFRKALEWYADNRNWIKSDRYDSVVMSAWDFSDIDEDGGERARTALAPAKPEQKPS